MTPSSARARNVGSLLALMAMVWHLLTVLAPAGQPPPPGTEGRDYASYHYAAQVAARGGDPYEMSALGERAREDGTRRWVHPFLYPPPFLLVATPFSWFSLQGGFSAWFLLNELCLLIAAVALARWLGERSQHAVAVVAAIVALTYGVAYGFELGQANLVVLALIAVAVWRVDERPVLAGVLVGAAGMLKMSPALLLLLWGFERRWSAVAGAVGMALVLLAMSLLLVPVDAHVHFFGEVLPGLLGGDYNGLRIKLGMFGNHSLPNVMHQLFPSGAENQLSTTARVSSTLVLVSLGALLWRLGALRDRTGWAAIGRVGLVLVAMLLMPAFTYEHHLVLAIPAMSAGLLASFDGRLGVREAVVAAACSVVLAYPLPHLRKLALLLGSGGGAWLVQEAPFFALWGLGWVMFRLASIDASEEGIEGHDSSDPVLDDRDEHGAAASDEPSIITAGG